MPSYKIINTPSKYTGGIQEEGQRGGAEIGRYKYILIKEINWYLFIVCFGEVFYNSDNIFM